MNQPQLSFLDRWLDARADARINLGESGMANIALDNIIPPDAIAAQLGAVDFDHNDTLGSLPLRQQICRLYGRITPGHVLVTAGITEALLVYLMSQRRPGANVVVTVPAFHNLIDLPALLGLEVREVSLWPDDGYALPAAAIAAACDEATVAVLLTTPGNPMGNVFAAQDLMNLADRLSRLDCDIVLDEQYRLLPHAGEAAILPSPAGAGRFVGMGSPGKCLGVVGLRIGWIIASPDVIAAMQAAKTLTTHAISKLQDKICLRLLQDSSPVLARNRALVRRNADCLGRFISDHPARLTWVPPQAGTMAFPQLLGGRCSVQFGDALYRAHGVLVLPGEAFDRPGFFRIRLGVPEADFDAALAAIASTLQAL